MVAAGLLKGEDATCVHLMLDEFEEAGINFVNKKVVVSGNIITGKKRRLS